MVTYIILAWIAIELITYVAVARHRGWRWPQHAFRARGGR